MMLFFSLLYDWLPGVNVFRYITFRTVAAMLTSGLIVFLFGPSIISSLRVRQGKGQPIRADGPQTHFKKAGTPTMGGLMILSGVVISTLLWGNLFNIYLWVSLFVMLFFGAIGFYDDYLKVTKQTDKGFSGKARLSLEFLVASIASFIILQVSSPGLALPFVKEYFINLGWFFIPFSACVVVGLGNAVNLTDGLDGLAIVPVMVASLSFALIAYLSGNINFADYLQIHYVSGVGELAVLLGAVVG
ncbi:phospho-N-acetylmuramoyl-pentapeptide-transferase, partial [Bartonella bacilliformis]